MKHNDYYSEKELQELGFKALGRSVLISKTCRISDPGKVSIGNHVLIDDFAILEGSITIGNHVHISANCELFTGDSSSITISDCCAIASHSSFYALTDEFVGPYLSSSAIPRKYRRVTEKDIVLEKYVQIGTHSVILPGAHLGEGCAFGAMSLISRSTKGGGVYVGGAAHKLQKIYQRDLDEIRRKGYELAEADQRKASHRKNMRGGYIKWNLTADEGGVAA